MQTIKGGCHCNNINYQLHWPLESNLIAARACDCSFCSKHNGIMTSHVDATLEININDWDVTTSYRFATKTADFLVCSNCGVMAAVVSKIDNSMYGVVNIHSFDNLKSWDYTVEFRNYDSEDINSRLARRASAWIPNVRINSKNS